jgi:hypothetical protein
MPSVISRKKDVKVYTSNPFTDDMVIDIGTKRLTVSGGKHVDTVTGEITSHSGIHVIQKVDRTRFIKVYTDNVKPLFNLPPSCLKVISFLMTELQKVKNAEAIHLPWVSAEKFFKEDDVKLSRSAFQRALKILLEKGFIAESDVPQLFWINPNLFFNGDRLKITKEFVVDESSIQTLDSDPDNIEDPTTSTQQDLPLNEG